jgi:hypothetical protein
MSNCNRMNRTGQNRMIYRSEFNEQRGPGMPVPPPNPEMFGRMPERCNCSENPGGAGPVYPPHEMHSHSLAMAYVPWQHFRELYGEAEALGNGTVFKELNLPFGGGRCCP